MAEKIEDTTPEETSAEETPEVATEETPEVEVDEVAADEANEPAVDLLEDARMTAEQNVRNETASE